LHNSTIAQQHNCTTAQLHNSAIAQQHNCTAAQLHNCLNTVEIPQSYKRAAKRLKFKTIEISQNSDVKNWAYVEVWARRYPF
jgi:hypothetical protein